MYNFDIIQYSLFQYNLNVQLTLAHHRCIQIVFKNQKKKGTPRPGKYNNQEVSFHVTVRMMTLLYVIIFGSEISVEIGPS